MHTTTPSSSANHAAWYAAPIDRFVLESVDSVLGALSGRSPFDVDVSQIEAWAAEIQLLRGALSAIDGWIYLEFDIPRLGSRIDAVVVTSNVVIPIEFKVGETEFRRADYEQAWDYALDLRNFHAGSESAELFPVLAATDASSGDLEWSAPHADGVRPPRRCSGAGLRDTIEQALAGAQGQAIDAEGWGRAPYHPTPTIIEAARALYGRHTVDSIARNDAGATNLSVTSLRVEEVIDEVRRAGGKAIVFITGVPGAGKTLVGLNVATQRREEGETHAVYLSGNGPLVEVLREALTRDEVARRKALGERPRKGAVAQPIKAFIQNVHHFRDDGLRDEERPPADHVVIFDESQRAWDKAKTSDFMRKRKNRAGFNQSEPEFLIAYMDRHPDWAVVICLVGGGQEIHTGEAGIGAWFDAVREAFPEWQIYVSPQLQDSEYAAAGEIAQLAGSARLHQEPALHLAVSMRSFRAERLSGFVKSVLDGERRAAKQLLGEFRTRYPLAITRDLNCARRWLRTHARGSERMGLVASSQAQRLKPHAIDVRVSINPVHYFLDDSSDTRSSSFLEDAATEFQIQGLELDWVCLSWDADLRRTGSGWSHHSFRGDKWTKIHKDTRRQYQLNAYRVLLTRARQGMVLFVPLGDCGDATRRPEYYDGTYEYLVGLGIPEVR